MITLVSFHRRALLFLFHSNRWLLPRAMRSQSADVREEQKKWSTSTNVLIFMSLKDRLKIDKLCHVFVWRHHKSMRQTKEENISITSFNLSTAINLRFRVDGPMNLMSSTCHRKCLVRFPFGVWKVKMCARQRNSCGNVRTIVNRFCHFILPSLWLATAKRTSVTIQLNKVNWRRSHRKQHLFPPSLSSFSCATDNLKGTTFVVSSRSIRDKNGIENHEVYCKAFLF